MSESVIYDTHRCIKRITKTGVSEDSAEAIIGSVTELIETNIATKADLALLESRLIKWIVGTMAGTILAFVGTIVTLMK